MSEVRFADIYEPVVFSGTMQEAQAELNRFIMSGIAVDDPGLAAKLAVGGHIGEITNYDPITIDEPNYSDDVVGNVITNKKIAKKVQIYRAYSHNASWGIMTMAKQLALQDPVQAIANRVGKYFATANERRLIASCVGILADNVASNSSDMLETVANDSALAITDAERISAITIIDAEQTMGDRGDVLTAIAVPSIIAARLKKQNLITFIPNARGEVNIPTYLGKILLVDDSMPVVNGANRVTYTCILFGQGVFSWANGVEDFPVESYRAPAVGNGGGETVLHYRETKVLHPMGFSFDSGSVAGQSPTLAELRLAANWSRKWTRKNIPLAFLQVND